MKKVYSDLRAGLILVLGSLLLYFVLIPIQIKTKAGAASLAADFFPKLLTLMIGFCGLLLAATSAYDLYRNKEKLKKEQSESAWNTDYKVFLPHAMFLAVMVLYLISMQYLGFVLSSIPFLVFLLWHFGQPGLLKNFLMSAVYVAVVYIIFSNGFRIRFPAGPLGF